MLKRIQQGSRGVKLKAEFDGYRYWTSQQWVDDWIREVSEARRVRSEHLMRPVVSPSLRAKLAYEELLEL